ncbi:MAG: tRNA glutamyl-Q(34) synthetase GluQRS [Lautropia sp.]
MTSPPRRYVGRFAPSPTGPLHAGSVVAALASWLDARAHDGVWLLRIEDVDAPRTVAGAADRIVGQLRFLGLQWDAEPVWQSRRDTAYRAAFERLRAAGRIYGCACTRREIADSIAMLDPAALQRHREPVYPGTCRHGIAAGRSIRAWRFRVDGGDDEDGVAFLDRRLGPQRQHPVRDAGDFVVRRADGLWAYQLAVVVDDGEAGVTDVVRGADLLTSTGRQIRLQHALGLPTPRYLHLPLVPGSDGEKLSKQNGATAIDDSGATPPTAILADALAVLGLPASATSDPARWLGDAVDRWADRFMPPA